MVRVTDSAERAPTVADAMEPAESTAAMTLELLLDALSEAVVQLVVAPHGLQVPVSNIVIHDDSAATRPGDLVLGVGIDPDTPIAGSVLADVAATGATGLVVKCPTGPPDQLVSQASDLGVAVLCTSMHVDWGQLYTLMRTATAANALSMATSEGVRSVPLGDLFALANAIAAAVGGAATIEDRQLQVLAHSNLGHPVDRVRLDSIVGRKVPEDIRRETVELYRQVWRTDSVVRLRAHEPTDSRARLAVAIRVGTEVLGTIWVLQGDRSFTDADERALIEASRLAALHLMRHSAAGDVERRRRGEVLRSVLDGRVPFRSVAPTLADGASSQFTVVVMELTDRNDDAQQARDIERLVDIVALHAETFRRDAATVGVGSQVYVIVFEHHGAGPVALREFVNETVARAAHALKRTATAGIGSTSTDRDRFADSRRDADAALRVSRAGGHGPVVHVDDVRQQVAILRLVEVAGTERELRTDLFARLADHDRVHGTEYTATVVAYLDATGNVAEAAGALFVHANTLRYRLKRMAESTGIDIDDSDTRFLLEFEQRIARLSD